MGAQTLRCSALALFYSAAECCAPVWMNSARTRLVDRQLTAIRHNKNHSDQSLGRLVTTKFCASPRTAPY